MLGNGPRALHSVRKPRPNTEQNTSGRAVGNNAPLLRDTFSRDCIETSGLLVQVSDAYLNPEAWESMRMIPRIRGSAIVQEYMASETFRLPLSPEGTVHGRQDQEALGESRCNERGPHPPRCNR